MHGVVLPLSLILVTFSLGLGLSVDDFRRVLTEPRGFLAGAIVQLLLLPAVALALVAAFGLRGELALGVMILAVCPGGVTSNLVTRLARGSVALSVTLTGVISLVAILTVPLLVALWMRLFLGTSAPPLDVAALILAMLTLTGAPICSGMVVRQLLPGFAQRAERMVLATGGALFAATLVATAAGNHDLLLSSLADAGAVLLALAAAMAAIGWLVASTLVRGRADRVAVAIEAALQNGPLGVTIAVLIDEAGGLTKVAMPSGLYALAMYLGALPVVMISRRRTRALTASGRA